MIKHSDIENAALRKLIKQKYLAFAGNNRLKIYGTLSCTSGKRMMRKNRVFFASSNEAIDNGFRPCGHCMKLQYLIWKQNKQI